MKKYLILFLTLTMILGLYSPVLSAGEEPAPVASISASSTTTYAGSYAYITVRASDFAEMASLDISVFYDSGLMTVNHTSIRSFASNTQYSINTDIEGEIRFSMIAPNGISGSGDIFEICFRIHPNALSQRITVILAAGEAYDVSLQPIQVLSSNGQITVSETQQSIEQVSFYSNSVSNVKQGDTFDISFSSSLNSLAAADFEFYYDDALLKLENVQIGDKLRNAKNAVYAINDTTQGYVKISYIAMEGLTGYANPVVKLSFSVCENIKAETFVEMNVSGLCNASLISMSASTVSASIHIEEKQTESVLPNIRLSSYHGLKQEFSVSVMADGETGIAAGDFTVEYDPSFLACVSAVNQNGAMVIANTSKPGKVTFSYVNQEGISKDTELILLTFKKISTDQCSTELKLSGKNLVSAELDEIYVSYMSSNVTVHTKEANAPCTKDKICTICGSLLEQKMEHIFDSSGKCTLCGASKLLRGDMNGDEKLNSVDAIYLLRYTIMPTLYPVTQSGDVNGDGKINSADAIYLLRHTIMPQLYPLA